ncbi:MAG TPA: hypothetical protein VGW38_26645 [Chloroflexota bacterium]|nr:hypothetical protein [Chloroflexota bacterium]
MLMDTMLPAYQFNEVHTIQIGASPADVMAAIQSVRAREIPGFVLLMGLRSLPLLLRRRLRETGTSRRGVPADVPRERAILEEMQNGGFVLLGNDADRELMIGVIGQFWRPTGVVVLGVTSVEAFRAFSDPRYAKAVMNFQIIVRVSAESRLDRHTATAAAPVADLGVLLRTETRISVGDPRARRRFALYWRLIQPGSGLIRRMWLLAIKRRAERSASQGQVPAVSSRQEVTWVQRSISDTAVRSRDDST